MSDAKKAGGLNDRGLIDENTSNLNSGGHADLIPEGTNAFGGGNPQGLYVPMTETEQEVLQRLGESNDLELVVGGWGTIPNPVLTVGDHRLRIDFRVTFKGLLVAQPVYHLDLELRLGNGMSVYKDRKPTLIDGKPLEVFEGLFIDMQWDIAIKHMDPEFVRLIKPGATGLTSRRQDRDTGEMTEQGNMKLDPGRQKILKKLGKGQARIRKLDEGKAIQASVQSGDKLVGTPDGVAYQPKR
tara:strand:- start:2469 stop:3191 length:723 start_codon:yes stop_codon:yes gene_type:complete